MSYEDTLAYLYSRLPQYQQQGEPALRRGIGNMSELSAAQGHPERRYPTLHIAGTNGKGTTAHTLAELLRLSGYRTGLYTSPHLRHFGERIQIDGQPLAEAEIMGYVEMYKPLIERLSPSFFEISCAMAMYHFALQRVDIAVVETGLGGRWDSTNVLRPILSLITNISYDHTEVLGETLSEIAYEKAGIAKQNTPLLLGSIPLEAQSVVASVAAQLGAPLRKSEAYRVALRRDTIEARSVDIYYKQRLRYKEVQLGLSSDYYVDNLPLVIAAADELRLLGFRWQESQLRKALAGLSVPGRFQLLGKAPLRICDVAHNAAGLRSLFGQLQRVHTTGRWHIVIGFSKEKKRSELLPLLPRLATYYATEAQQARACPSSVLSKELRAEGLSASAYPKLKAAWQAALQAASPEDLVLLCGSVYLVGELET